jgi:hypothetical protein
MFLIAHFSLSEAKDLAKPRRFFAIGICYAFSAKRNFLL